MGRGGEGREEEEGGGKGREGEEGEGKGEVWRGRGESDHSHK